MRRVAFLALLAVWFALPGCVGAPTFDQQFHMASRAYLAAKSGYLAVLVADNGQVQRCYEAHPELHGAATRSACPPHLSVDVRAQALTLVEQADVGIFALNAAIQAGDPVSGTHVDALENIQASALELPLLLSAEVH